MTVAEIDALIQQAGYAETSIDGKLGSSTYTSTRRLRNERGEEFNMFAISILTPDGQAKDVIYARTPELAKFIPMLIKLGDQMTRMIHEALSAQ